MNLLLSALVLAWGVAPPVSQHAHSGGGDSTHQHDAPQEVARHGSHDHESGDEHHEHAASPEVSLLADDVLHLHWRLLGVEFSMPVPEEPVEGDDDENTVSLMIVRGRSDVVPATLAGPSFGRVLLAALCTPSVDVVGTLTPPLRSPNLVTSIPLCDSARLERSGVLLA